MKFKFILTTYPSEHFGSQGISRDCIAEFFDRADAELFGTLMTRLRGAGSWEIEEIDGFQPYPDTDLSRGA